MGQAVGTLAYRAAHYFAEAHADWHVENKGVYVTVPPPSPPSPACPWDVKAGVLGELPETLGWSYLLPELRRATERLLVAANGADVVFVGRSPEPLLYYLLSLTEGLKMDWRVRQLNVSLRLEKLNRPKRLELRREMQQIGVSLRSLVSEDRRVCLSDVVAFGSTFALLAEVLNEWAAEEQRQESLHRRVKFVGLSHRESHPWYAQPACQPFSTQNIRLSWPLWDYLGNWGCKVAHSRPPSTWAQDVLKERSEERLQGLADARGLYLLGQNRTERETLIRVLHDENGQKSEAARQLILKWRGKSRP